MKKTLILFINLHDNTVLLKNEINKSNSALLQYVVVCCVFDKWHDMHLKSKWTNCELQSINNKVKKLSPKSGN